MFLDQSGLKSNGLINKNGDKVDLCKRKVLTPVKLCRDTCRRTGSAVAVHAVIVAPSPPIPTRMSLCPAPSFSCVHNVVQAVMHMYAGQVSVSVVIFVSVCPPQRTRAVAWYAPRMSALVRRLTTSPLKACWRLLGWTARHLTPRVTQPRSRGMVRAACHMGALLRDLRSLRS